MLRDATTHFSLKKIFHGQIVLERPGLNKFFYCVILPAWSPKFIVTSQEGPRSYIISQTHSATDSDFEIHL